MSKADFVTQDLLSKIYQHKFEHNKLPNQRQLAQDYLVSRDTVQRAIGQLVDMGIIYTVQGSGIFVKEAAMHNPLIYNSLTQNPYTRISSKMVFLKQIVADENDRRTFGVNYNGLKSIACK